MKRTLIIGDIHGCYQALSELLDKVNFDPASDRIIAVGDLVEKGPDNDKVVEFFMMYGESVKGNHEESIIRFWKHEEKKKTNPRYKNPMKTFEERVFAYNQLSDKHYHFMDGLPWHISFNVANQKYLVIHGGIFPKTHPSDMDPKLLCRLRFLQMKEKLSSSGRIIPDGWKLIQVGKELRNDPFWAELYEGEFGHIFYGHQSYNGALKSWKHATGLDLGAVYGYNLCAAIVFDDGHIEYEMVSSQKYADMWRP